jgi:hypothetical protein
MLVVLCSMVIVLLFEYIKMAPEVFVPAVWTVFGLNNLTSARSHRLDWYDPTSSCTTTCISCLLVPSSEWVVFTLHHVVAWKVESLPHHYANVSMLRSGELLI